MWFTRLLHRLSEVTYVASKRQKRRKRQRAAQKKKETKMNVVKVKEYEVALQKGKTDPIYVFKVRETDEKELVPFILRMYGVTKEEQLNVLDIHEWADDGKVYIIRESAGWPTGVQTIKKSGFAMRGIGSEAFKKESKPAVVALSNYTQTKAKETTVQRAVDEVCIPLKKHTLRSEA